MTGKMEKEMERLIEKHDKQVREQAINEFMERLLNEYIDILLAAKKRCEGSGSRMQIKRSCQNCDYEEDCRKHVDSGACGNWRPEAGMQIGVDKG